MPRVAPNLPTEHFSTHSIYQSQSAVATGLAIPVPQISRGLREKKQSASKTSKDIPTVPPFEINLRWTCHDPLLLPKNSLGNQGAVGEPTSRLHLKLPFNLKLLGTPAKVVRTMIAFKLTASKETSAAMS